MFPLAVRRAVRLKASFGKEIEKCQRLRLVEGLE